MLKDIDEKYEGKLKTKVFELEVKHRVSINQLLKEIDAKYECINKSILSKESIQKLENTIEYNLYIEHTKTLMIDLNNKLHLHLLKTELILLEAKKAAEEEAKKAKEAEKAAKKEQERLEREAKKAAEEEVKKAKEAKKEQERLERESKKEQSKKKGKPVEEEEEVEVDRVKKIEEGGKKYLKSLITGIIYDYKKYVSDGEQIKVGKWNEITNKIDFEDDEESEEEYDE